MSTGNETPFPTTQWTYVIAVADQDSERARAALNQLCQTYWPPLYSFVRRTGKSAPDAEDLVQGFLSDFIERQGFTKADPEKGSLRSFLLVCLKRFLASEYRRDTALKRGGGKVISMETEELERQFSSGEQTESKSPEELFDQRWALTLLEQTLKDVERSEAENVRRERFAVYRPFLEFGFGDASTYREAAEKLNLPIGTVKSDIFFLRKKFQECLRKLVHATLANPSPDQVKAEIQVLHDVLLDPGRNP